MPFEASTNTYCEKSSDPIMHCYGLVFWDLIRTPVRIRNYCEI